MVHDPHGRRVRIDNAEARRAKFRDALQPVLAGLGEDDSIGLLASISAICSASGWEMMKDNWQLDRAAAARAAQSGVEALIDAARHKTDLAADAAVGVTTKGDRG
ncbi:hypothetical protein GGC65_002424 [Sphingopyxis sp. OAS728]|nr:hypothetical protein [Sphingopyxis sp. OAS728]